MSSHSVPTSCRIYIYGNIADLDDNIIEHAYNSDLQRVFASAFEKRSPKARKQSLAARLLLLFAAENSFGISPANVDISYGINGKPYFNKFPECYFNLSHSGNHVMCITAPFPAGIDTEHERYVDPSVMRRICTQKELANVLSSTSPPIQFLRFWTLKESYIKATGDGMSFPMRNVEFTISPESIISTHPGWFFQSELKDCIFSATVLVPADFPHSFYPELIHVDSDALLQYL